VCQYCGCLKSTDMWFSSTRGRTAKVSGFVKKLDFPRFTLIAAVVISLLAMACLLLLA
jgi:hypothetical protein